MQSFHRFWTKTRFLDEFCHEKIAAVRYNRYNECYDPQNRLWNDAIMVAHVVKSEYKSYFWIKIIANHWLTTTYSARN